MSMEALYHQTNKLVHEVQDGLGRVERAMEEDVAPAEEFVRGRIDLIVSNCERLDMLVNKEPPTRRVNAKLRVDQLKYDCQHLQAALRSLQTKRYQREVEDREREALLSRKFSANDPDTAICIDGAVQHNAQLRGAHRGVEELLDSGTSILTNLREQRHTLKGAHKKILDVMNNLGLSNTVLRLIEQRTHQDKFILYGGMIVTCIIMFLIWRYFTG